MNANAGRIILAASGAGFPLTQAVIRRFGRPGALLAEGVTAGLLVRDLALIAKGARGRLERGPATLLCLETGAAAAATALGIGALRPGGLQAAQTRTWKVPATELARRLAVGTLFGLHTTRFQIYLAPGSGLRARPADIGPASAV